MPKPKFLAEPSHRIKVVASHCYKLANQPFALSRVDKLMSRIMKKYWGYMISQYKHGTLEKCVKAAQAPLEHLFNKHTHCSEWCGVKRDELIGKFYVNPMGYL